MSALAFVRQFLVCKISHELVGGLEPNLHGYNIGCMIKAWLGFSDFDIIFKVTTELNRSNLRVCGCVLGTYVFSENNTRLLMFL